MQANNWFIFLLFALRNRVGIIITTTILYYYYYAHCERFRVDINTNCSVHNRSSIVEQARRYIKSPTTTPSPPPPPPVFSWPSSTTLRGETLPGRPCVLFPISDNNARTFLSSPLRPPNNNNIIMTQYRIQCHHVIDCSICPTFYDLFILLLPTE